jgi:ParB family chromosome partitioning protein
MTNQKIDSTKDTHVTTNIDMMQIEPNPDNPRTTFEATKMQELAESMRGGLEQPIVLRTMLDGKGKKYRIIAGERRWRAAKMLGWATIPARVKIETLSDKDAQIVTVRENLERQDLSPFELAVAACTFADKHRMTGAQIGEVFHRSVSYVNNLLGAMRNLHKDILAAWAKGHPMCTTDNLNTLKGIDDKAAQLEAWTKLCEGVTTAPAGDGSGGGSNPVEPTVTKVKASTPLALEVYGALKALMKDKTTSAADADRYALAYAVVGYILGKRKTAPVKVEEEETDTE